MRYDLEFAPSLVGSDSEMVARSDGDWILYVSHLAEVRQTQRRMIAALYWRAGVADIEANRPLQSIHMEARQRGGAAWLLNTARAMEAACPR